MLSRIANYLYWMGRYLERAEHTSRFVMVHHYDALEMQHHANKKQTNSSIASMMGFSQEISKKLSEKEFEYFISLDVNNPTSFISTISRARENARGTRDVISTELWESMNRMYLHISNYDTKKLHKEGVWKLCEDIIDHWTSVKCYIDNSMIHDTSWSMIKLGMYLERASQVSRMTYTKLVDIERIGGIKTASPEQFLQCISLLKSAEAYDMSRIYYKSVPSLTNSLSFLVLHPDFPKSLLYNIEHIQDCLTKIGLHDSHELQFKVGKLAAQIKYMTPEDVMKDPLKTINNSILDIYGISDQVESTYLLY